MKDKIVKKNLPVIIVSTLVLVLGIVGLTLALTNGMSSNVVIDTANLGVEYSGNLSLPSTNLFPIEDSEIDTNTENVLTVNFTVKGVQSNPTDIPIIYDVVLSDLDVPEELKSEYLKWQLKKNGSVISTGSFSPKFDTIKDGRLTLTEIQQDLPSYNSTADSYEFKLWISESCPGNDMSQCGPEQDQSNMLNKTLSGKIEAILYTKSKQALVRDPDLSRTSSEMLAYLGLSAKSGTPSFGSVSTTDEGVYAAQDDYGTSYYYRGAVENNYVYFAGFYWRIIRINGNGTIRMIYDGTSAYSPGESGNNRRIGTGPYNSNNNDNAYVGYMYGQVGASSYDEAHANINNSRIKTIVDEWYVLNIKNKGYDEYIADVIYCNDRQIDNLSGYGNALGYGTNQTAYMASYRLYTNKSPVLTCTNKNDRFTVDDTTNGNGALTYPVGLITADEVAMAGGLESTNNRNYYLNTGYWYFTMSPYFVNESGTVNMYIVNGGNYAGRLNGTNNLNGNGSIRPVLSLKSSVTLTGTGTMSDPYRVES